MKILARHLMVSKSVDEVTGILKSSAYYLPKAIFENTEFSMYRAKRRNGGYLSLTRISGSMLENEDGTMVSLEIHANLNFYIGCIIIILGIMGVIYCIVSNVNRWIPYLGMIILGVLISGQTLWESVEMLDLLQHKLMRS